MYILNERFDDDELHNKVSVVCVFDYSIVRLEMRQMTEIISTIL